MPIYAYRCESCGHAKDVLQKMSDPLLTTCPACGAESFKKQVTAAGFQLKGSGWYATDFKGDQVAQLRQRWPRLLRPRAAVQHRPLIRRHQPRRQRPQLQLGAAHLAVTIINDPV